MGLVDEMLQDSANEKNYIKPSQVRISNIETLIYKQRKYIEELEDRICKLESIIHSK